MLTFVFRRVLLAIPVLLLSSILMFGIVRATTNPLARFSQARDTGLIERERTRLGLDKPLPQQYLTWAGGFVKGDWGESYTSRRSVAEEIRGRLWNTVQLILWGIVISAFIAILVGVYSASKQYSVLDYTFTGASFLGLSMPPFFFALLAIHFLVFKPRGWFDLDEPLLYSVGKHSATNAGFVDYLRHLALPVMTLSVQLVAGWSRFQRSSMLDALSADYIRTARAKGLARRRVVIRHGLRNALIPLTLVMAIDIGLLFGGLIVTESIFAWPGMGQLFVKSLQTGDTNILLPWLMVVAFFVLTFNLIADVLLGILDPRVRLDMTLDDRDLESSPTAAPMGGVASAATLTDPGGPHTSASGEELEEAAEVAASAEVAPARSQSQLVLRRFLRHKLALGALTVLVLLYLSAIFAKQLAPFDIDQSLRAETLKEALQGPSARHWFGTDQLGRDMFTRVLYAGRVSLVIGLAVAVISTTIGTVIGAFAGYVGGTVDRILMFVTDLALVVPGLAVLMIAQKGIGGSTTSIVIILSLLFWTTIARVIRGVFLSLKEKEFVESARALGASTPRVIFRHMLPNTVGPIVVNATLVLGVAILTESTLSFLGFGVQAVSWGNLVAEAKGWVGSPNAYLIYFPGLALLITVLCVNFLGDGLRDALDPQAKH